MIRITEEHRQAIRRHAEQTYPEECCGVMVGRTVGPIDDVQTVRLIAAENEREEESRHNRFLIPPEVILKAQKEGRADGLDIVGYYHSHPDHPAEPSEFDREHAWPNQSYLIVSVENGVVVDERSWRLTDDRERFEEEGLSFDSENWSLPAGASRFPIDDPP